MQVQLKGSRHLASSLFHIVFIKGNSMWKRLLRLKTCVAYAGKRSSVNSKITPAT